MVTPAAPQLQDDRFLILETLGHGGMASVYRAFDRVGQRVVALKVQLQEEPGGPRHPFAAEFDAWSRLSHPNVVHALELGHARRGPIARGTPYLVLEHVAGGPAHVVLRPGCESPETVEAFAVEVLRGLGHVHGAGLVHRDLKPANILVGAGPAGRRPIKLTDFGLATPLGQAEEPGRISGSLPYVSPEALCGRALDERADLYGLGILLYLLTAGSLPLQDATPDAWVRWHLTGEPPDPARAGWRGPRRLARFIRRLTERSPEGRPADATQALSLLDPRCAGAQTLRTGSSPRPDAPVAPPAGSGDSGFPRAERARLRLALDAVRLGAVRTLPAPRPESLRPAFWREAAISAQVLGLGYYQIVGTPADPADLDGVALGLLAGCAADPADAVRRFDLLGTLRLALVGGLPVLDRTGAVPIEAASPPRIRRLARFFMHCAGRGALALRIGREARAADPRVAALCRELRRAARSADRPRRRRGGLLLLVD